MSITRTTTTTTTTTTATTMKEEWVPQPPQHNQASFVVELACLTSSLPLRLLQEEVSWQHAPYLLGLLQPLVHSVLAQSLVFCSYLDLLISVSNRA
jgi:hypothetical protein